MKNRIMNFYAELEEYTIGIYSEKIRDYVRSRYPTLAGMNTRLKLSKPYPGLPSPFCDQWSPDRTEAYLFTTVQYPNIPNDMILELAVANMHEDLAKAREEMTERALKL